ncbi:MAG: S-layer homology domain-containing protein [Muribaculaceae bacterium]|nr:S-layer homology domain-containing protein [Roseburia sp.]MCM1432077.1 S-layer homology domain-containing protein [Muribaculaceae bacterium]MCM1492123.1 S-layer homology domain-containing protein [Muribaculaceae bacterium]
MRKIRGRRCLAAVLAVMLLVTQARLFVSGQELAAGAGGGSSMPQVQTNPAYNEAMAKKTLQAMGIVGSSQTSPEGLAKKVTRQVFAKKLVELSGCDKKAGAGRTSLYADVKAGSAYAPYIRICVKNGWMKGNLNGKFRPKSAVTLQEAVYAVTAMLGYGDADFEDGRTEARMAFYREHKLNSNISRSAKEKLTWQDAINLFYNTLVAATKSGSIYAETLGYPLDARGDIDYLALTYSQMEGPVIAGDDWRTQIPFEAAGALVYIDGKQAGGEQIRQYDVLYYNRRLQSIYVYQTRVTGKLTAVSPDRYHPSSITVDGTVYSIEDQAVACTVSAMGTYEIGDYVTVLLGREDVAAAVGDPGVYNALTGGIVVAKEERLPIYTESGKKEYYLSVLDTTGSIREYPVDRLQDYALQTPVEILYSYGRAVVQKVSLRSLSGTVSGDAGAFAGYGIAENARIVEYRDKDTYGIVPGKRLAGLTISYGNLLYYHLNEKNEITDMVIKDVTGDNYTYGILLSATELLAEEEVPGTAANPVPVTKEKWYGNYTYQIGDGIRSVSTEGYSFGLEGYKGPVQITVNEQQQVTSMKRLNSFTVLSVTEPTVSDGAGAYMLADDYSVYLKVKDEYYATTLAKVKNISDYTLTAYYNGASGGRVRIIVAVAK